MPSNRGRQYQRVVYPTPEFRSPGPEAFQMSKTYDGPQAWPAPLTAQSWRLNEPAFVVKPGSQVQRVSSKSASLSLYLLEYLLEYLL